MFWRRRRDGVRCAGAAAALALALALSGCAGGPEFAKPEPTPIPPAAPRTTGDSAASREHKRLVASFGGEYRAPAMERLLNEALAKLATASDSPGEAYRVTILNSPVVNAFALPSGNLYVTRGLLALANDTSEVAAVMAHEIAHISARHAARRAEEERKAVVVSQVVAEVLKRPAESQELQARQKLSFASFSRQQEIDADEIGVRVIGRAGYDPYGAARFLESLGRSTTLRASALGASGADQPDFLSTHPSTPERVAHAVAAARQYGAPGIGDGGRQRYRAALAGIAYGDDPAEGHIRGRAFIHPKLGFAFTAPDGFTLENTAKVLLGVGAGGNDALRLEVVRLGAAQNLETYVSGNWIEGIKAEAVEPLSVNGLQGATALARGADWTFRLAAIRMGPSVYRLIFASRSLTPELDQKLRASIDSFHRATAEDAAAARPLRVELVTAGFGDTSETLARRMAVPDKPLETFMTLNALHGVSALTAGESYKIVTE